MLVILEERANLPFVGGETEMWKVQSMPEHRPT